MIIAYLDCFAGISGDMLLGALIDVGWQEDRLGDVIARLRVGVVQLKVARVVKHAISATQVEILSSSHQPHRGLNDLSSIVIQADLPGFIQERAISALKLLAEAESAVHNVPIEKIHFHEVGAVDTIVDIVGALVGMHELKIENVHCTSVPWSRGTVKTEHGILPVPPPAVAMLLRNLPVVGVDIEGETVTHTGATLVRTLVTHFGSMPTMQVSRVGYGAGQRDWPDRPNALRLMIGESTESASGLQVESLTQLACNIDDMNPEWYGALLNRLYDAAALDVWLTPVQMKKNRPGIVVEVLSRPENADALRALLLRHTPALGVRAGTIIRSSFPRRFETVETPYGSVRMKIATLPDGSQKASPEHDDCASCADEKGVSVGDVWLAAIRSWQS